MHKLLRKTIREGYKKKDEYIKKHYPRISPYDLIQVDWLNVFTKIEYNVWCDIRRFGCKINLPQYPVGPYFIDFADPIKKIGIEVDSIAWHKDKEKDRQRQSRLENMGWIIYRIPSRITYKDIEDCMEDEENSGRVILDIMSEHYRSS